MRSAQCAADIRICVRVLCLCLKAGERLDHKNFELCLLKFRIGNANLEIKLKIVLLLCLLFD